MLSELLVYNFSVQGDLQILVQAHHQRRQAVMMTRESQNDQSQG